MASRRQKRLAKKAASKQRFQTALTLKQAPVPARQPQSSPQADAPSVTQLQTTEPKILAEDIGKLGDLGLDERAVSYLRKGGIRLVREVPEKGEAKIRGIYGMKTHFPQLKQILRSYGAEIPA